jgi:quercetin dioxygenase-like cupin family protein
MRRLSGSFLALRHRFRLTFCVAAIAWMPAASISTVFARDGVNHAFDSKVITLLEEQLSANPDQEFVARIYVLQPGAAVPRHVHDGEAFHFVLEGEWAAEVEGRGTRLLKAGDSQFVPRGKWHGGKAVGEHTLRLLAVVVADKGKPLSTIVE